MPFKDNLVRLRKQRGWTQQHLADTAGITVGIVRRYEGGNATPNLPSLRKLAEALEVSADELGRLPAERLDRRLAERFEALAKLPPAEREAVEIILDTVLANHQLRDLVEQQNERLRSAAATKREPRESRAIAELTRHYAGRLGIVAISRELRGERPAIVVLAEGDLEAVQRALPREVDGLPVVVEASGAVVALER